MSTNRPRSAMASSSSAREKTYFEQQREAYLADIAVVSRKHLRTRTPRYFMTYDYWHLLLHLWDASIYICVHICIDVLPRQ